MGYDEKLWRDRLEESNKAPKLKRIDELHAFITSGEKGEGVIGAMVDGVLMPFVAADKARVDQLRGPAKRVADELGATVKLVKFSNREDLEVIEPEKRQ